MASWENVIAQDGIWSLFTSKSRFLISDTYLIYNVYFLILLMEARYSLFKLKTSKPPNPRMNIFFKNSYFSNFTPQTNAFEDFLSTET